MNLHYGFAWELHLHNMDNLSGLIIEWYESLPLIAVIPPIAMVHGGPPFPVPAQHSKRFRILVLKKPGACMFYGVIPMMNII